ncbi:MAG: 16S rRNA (uracil(1498)-N(3))-methyltransferase [Actinomycetaceae bacterium]|nr:16S rRNA (uracil(1498)-N(3))-methyltransferase [Actinomycetaceae bacterium]
MSRPVYLADVSLDIDEIYTLSGEEAYHAVVTKRSKKGELIDIVDGKGRRHICEIQQVIGKELVVQVCDVSVEKKDLISYHLIQALAKSGRDEQAVETCTEYGVFSIHPWQADRSISSWKKKEEKGRNKWVNICVRASKQSRRAHIPQVHSLKNTKELCSYVQEVVSGGARVYVCHEEADEYLVPSFMDFLEGMNDDMSVNVFFIVGPEGGISSQEIESLSAVGAVPVLLGRHILRSSSAGAYALALACACEQVQEKVVK